ncbi:hypothetical protein COCON_G00174060 [Conger conger]|uniref:Uncharacterized protein n=1 Tax=Conger conger TaxID=82655 RepID=A0A9Q1D488_CONCO|nr:hypothetical protein COCON_G00174060 [Conger conger]
MGPASGSTKLLRRANRLRVRVLGGRSTCTLRSRLITTTFIVAAALLGDRVLVRNFRRQERAQFSRGDRYHYIACVSETRNNKKIQKLQQELGLPARTLLQESSSCLVEEVTESNTATSSRPCRRNFQP